MYKYTVNKHFVLQKNNTEIALLFWENNNCMTLHLNIVNINLLILTCIRP